MAKQLEPLKSTKNFLKNVSGRGYKEALKDQIFAEKEHLGKIDALKRTESSAIADLVKATQTGNHEKAIAINKHMDGIERELGKRKGALQSAHVSVDEAKASMNHARKQLAVGGALAAGTVAGLYAAKKLHDKHKEKKEAEKTAFEMLDEMVKEVGNHEGLESV